MVIHIFLPLSFLSILSYLSICLSLVLLVLSGSGRAPSAWFTGGVQKTVRADPYPKHFAKPHVPATMHSSVMFLIVAEIGF